MPEVKVLGLRSLERYALRRSVQAAWNNLASQYPDQELELTEIKVAEEISRHTACLVLPSLMIDGKLVCSGRIPAGEEIAHWLQKAME